MPLYEYQCLKCKNRFEQLVRLKDDPEAGVCPKCNEPGANRKISRFRIGGQGDLRETTEFHGCHPSLGDEGDSESGKHTHGPGCGHGSSGHSNGEE